jgi:hypothetical protein
MDGVKERGGDDNIWIKKTDRVTGQKKVYDEEIHNLCSSPNNTRKFK